MSLARRIIALPCFFVLASFSEILKSRWSASAASAISGGNKHKKYFRCVIVYVDDICSLELHRLLSKISIMV